jgi:ketosteroid isomerase-like protein
MPRQIRTQTTRAGNAAPPSTQTRSKSPEATSRMQKKSPTSVGTAKRSKADSEVQELLNDFADALTSGDAKAIAQMWEIPGLVLGEEAVAVDSIEQVEEFFSGAKEQYNERGITDTRAEIQNLEWATDQIALVTVRWPYLDDEGEESGSESSTYILCRDADSDLKIRCVVMRGASEE